MVDDWRAIEPLAVAAGVRVRVAEAEVGSGLVFYWGIREDEGDFWGWTVVAKDAVGVLWGPICLSLNGSVSRGYEAARGEGLHRDSHDLEEG